MRNHVLKRDQQPQQPQTFETVSSVGIAGSSMYGTFGGVHCGLMSSEKISNQQPQNTRAQPCIVASHVLSDRFQTIYHEEDLARPRMKAWRICMSAGMIACTGIAYVHQVFGVYHRMKFKHVMMCDV